MELPSLAEDFVDPQKMKSIHEIMSFTDQNKDNAIQPREFIKAMDYFQEKIQPAMPGGNSAHGDIPGDYTSMDLYYDSASEERRHESNGSGGFRALGVN